MLDDHLVYCCWGCHAPSIVLAFLDPAKLPRTLFSAVIYICDLCSLSIDSDASSSTITMDLPRRCAFENLWSVHGTPYGSESQSWIEARSPNNS